MKIILNGFSGRMGAAVLEVSSNGYMDSEVVAGVDISPKDGIIPCYSSFSDIGENADCIIDFSNHASIKAVADYAVASNHIEEILETIDAILEKHPFVSSIMNLEISPENNPDICYSAEESGNHVVVIY